MKNCLGIEIGHYRIKIAYAEKGELKEFISERVQGMDLTDMHVCADLIKDLLKEYAIQCRNVVFVIRQEDVYVRRFEMPLMTEEQLRLNLPYEFHDYIGDEMDKYVFDYAMIQTKERTMDLLGAACTKTLSQQFEKLAKMARLKLVGLVPAVLGLEWSMHKSERITLFWIWEPRRCGFISSVRGFMILPVPWSRAVRRSSRSVWGIRTRCKNWELRWRKKTARRPTKKRWRLCWRSSTGPAPSRSCEF